MYCNNCGKQNTEDSKFCKYCGSEIVKVTDKVVKDKPKEEESPKAENTKPKSSLGGWLALVGAGLILGLIIQAYGVVEYFPLLSDTYEIPGYLFLLQVEFLGSIIFTIVTGYLLYLYFKKNKKFPHYYFIFLMASIGYVVIDHLLLASLTIPTAELQQIIDDTLAENSSTVGRTIITSIIWGAYIKKSKQVKATFTHD